MADPTRFARLTYRIAGIYGLIVLVPQYLLEQRIGQDQPPPITHPEYFYGFVGVGVAWQVAFLVMATDPVRYRALMPATILEKLSFGVATLVLFALGRVADQMAVAASIDLILGVAFTAAWMRTGSAGS